MTPYIVKGIISHIRYMADASEAQDIRIVMANDFDEACDKYLAYWAGKMVEYDIYYRVDFFEVMETIL